MKRSVGKLAIQSVDHPFMSDYIKLCNIIVFQLMGVWNSLLLDLLIVLFGQLCVRKHFQHILSWAWFSGVARVTRIGGE